MLKAHTHRQVSEEGDHDVGFDQLGGEVPDRPDGQVAFERAKDGFDFCKLNVDFLTADLTALALSAASVFRASPSSKSCLWPQFLLSTLCSSFHYFRESDYHSWPTSLDKAQWITEAFQIMQKRFQRIKAAVFWSERWENDDSSYSNLRVTSSPRALEAYRRGVADPFWLDRPIYR